MAARTCQGLSAPVVLAFAGAGFASLAVVDKIVGLVHHPVHLATVAYACLLGLLGWSSWRGIHVPRARLVRLSVYAATLLLVVLTAAYVFALRLSADPIPVLAWSELHRADDLLSDGKKDDAFLIYKNAYRQFPDSFPVLMRMGAVNYQLSDFERAQKFYARALEVAPTRSRWRALNDLGQTYWKLNHPETAIDYYFQARDAGIPESEMIDWHYRLAWAYFDEQNYDAAVDHYLTVARAGEKYAAASYYNAACAQARKLQATRDPHARSELIRQAVDNLRSAWKATTDPAEKEALVAGLSGSKEARDPDLAPLAGTQELAALLREIRSG